MNEANVFLIRCIRGAINKLMWLRVFCLVQQFAKKGSKIIYPVAETVVWFYE